MRIREMAVTADDIIAYGEELAEAELTQVSGGVYRKEGGCTLPPPKYPKSAGA